MIKETTRVIPYAKSGRTILLDPEECDRVLESLKRHGKV